MAGVDDSPIYRDLMRFRPEDLSPNAWAVKAGVSRTVWADMRRHGNPSRRTLEKLLQVAGSSLAEFEALRIESEPRGQSRIAKALAEPGAVQWTPAGLSPLPLVTVGLAGEWGRTASGIPLLAMDRNALIDRLPRPVGLAGDPAAYAITIVADSMWPRFRPGRRVAVSPASPVVVGDDVLLSLTEGNALLGELVRRPSQSLELRQFNPDVTFSIPSKEIAALHKISGELI
jgi:SOS-response transcriptional repressor LexA